MYHVAECFVRWLAPVLSFTAEEIWGHLPGARVESVIFAEWYAQLPAVTGIDVSAWDRILVVREGVSGELEKLRAAGAIGAALDAEVDIYCDNELLQTLARFADELRFIFITSRATVLPAASRPGDAVAVIPDSAWIRVTPSAHAKCVRCWHHCTDVGAHPEHPELCGRCVSNVAGSGEVRRYV